MLSALVAGALGPYLTDALHDRFGSYTLAFAIAVGLSGLSALAIWRAAPRKVRTVTGRTR
jgi:cyanate permease